MRFLKFIPQSLNNKICPAVTFVTISYDPALVKNFFGQKETLLYYPTALIVIRGFRVEFKNSQEWTYDYKRSFSAEYGLQKEANLEVNPRI